MPTRTLALLGFMAALSAAQAAPPDVYVAYPESGHRVPFDHVILEGSVTPGGTLTVNGQRVPVGADGLFMQWWPLKVGVNDLRLVTRLGAASATRTVRVTRTDTRPMTATPTAIDRASLTPSGPLEYWDVTGDTPAERRVPVSFRGSPGGRAALRVGGAAPLPLKEVRAGQYAGEFLVPLTPVQNAALTFTLTGRDGRTVTLDAPGTLSVTSGAARPAAQPPGSVQGLALNEATTALTDLSGAPLLYPRAGMTFTLVGRQGDDARVRLAPGLGALVTAAQLQWLPAAAPAALGGPITLDGAAAAPAAGEPPAVGAPPVIPPTPTGTSSPTPLPAVPVAPLPGPALPVPAAGDVRLRVPLGGARLPFTLRQDGPGGARLTLTLYGPLQTPLTAPAGRDPLLGSVAVGAPAPGVTQLTVTLAGPQAWGFHADYDGPDLILTLRRPPTLNPQRPLEGRVITLDPGHGGSQRGGAGSLRTPEKDLVLPVARRAAELLRAQGATVHLTRTGDVTLGLYERGLKAEATRSDLLVSIHANALPDGRDPRGIRGPEVYFTHPQAQPLAAAILGRLRAGLPDLGSGAGLKGDANLALTRPSAQPSLLVEMAYLTDPGNLRVLNSASGQGRLAQAIAQGVTDFYRAQVTPAR